MEKSEKNQSVPWVSQGFLLSTQALKNANICKKRNAYQKFFVSLH